MRFSERIRCKVRLLTPSILAASSLVNIGFNPLPVKFSRIAIFANRNVLDYFCQLFCQLFEGCTFPLLLLPF